MRAFVLLLLATTPVWAAAPTTKLDGASAAALVVAQQDFFRQSAENGGLLGPFDRYTVEVEKGDGVVRVTFIPPQDVRGGVGVYDISTKTWQVVRKRFEK
jgi:hypothetical protein